MALCLRAARRLLPPARDLKNPHGNAGTGSVCARYSGPAFGVIVRCYYSRMSLSSEWTTWHLTPRGWERGNEKTDYGKPVDRPTPSDCVLTVTYHEDVGAIGARMDRSTKENWRSPDVALVKTLLKKFGEAPSSL